MQDVSRTGMFVATTEIAPGTPVIVAFDVGGTRVANPGRVTHYLSVEDARATCRTPGVGIAFREPMDESFALGIESLLRRARTRQPADYHVVVADCEPRVLERLSTSFGGAGFSVATASNGLELLGACLRRKPDLVVVDSLTPMIDGFQLIDRLACDDRLASVPAILSTTEPSDLDRAFRRGAADVIMKPFTVVELLARARRVAQAPKRTERVLLSGSISDIGMASVLTMMELEKKTGRIVASNGHAAWIDVVDGRIVDAGWSLGTAHPRAVVLSVLDWAQGTFKLVASPARRRDTQLAMPVTHLLLENARR